MGMVRLTAYIYKGHKCHIRHDSGDGNVTLVFSTDHRFAESDGWTRVDKFEWEKTVPKNEVTILPEQ
jgi:hypothetical protein